MHTKFLLGSLKGRDHLENLGMDGSIIIQEVLEGTNSPTFLTFNNIA
jgi:hypothetical protein